MNQSPGIRSSPPGYCEAFYCELKEDRRSRVQLLGVIAAIIVIVGGVIALIKYPQGLMDITDPYIWCFFGGHVSVTTISLLAIFDLIGRTCERRASMGMREIRELDE